MAPLATQKTPDQAAALIQARVRGLQQRQRDLRIRRAVTKLQARQRARATRREFQNLLAFYNEQESFLQESKRRQLRLWHREQELYFLQHTTAEELDTIRTFQYNRSARRIQHAWREFHPPRLEDVDVSGLGRPFDPFGLGDTSDSQSETSSLSVVLEELYGELPRHATTPLDATTATRRRADLQERLQRLRKEKYGRTTTPESTRRELYDQLVLLRQQTVDRLHETRAAHRSVRPQRNLEAARLQASCQNRLAFLLDEKRVSSFLNPTKRPPMDRLTAEKQALETSASQWRPERQRQAWGNHTRVLQSVWGKSQWFETFVAGEQRDIRRVYSSSPWKQVWQWPKPTETQENEATRHDETTLTPMERFQFCLPPEDNDQDNQRDDSEDPTRPIPLDDKTASTWWRAHATQSHMSYKRLQTRRLQLLRRHQRTNQNEETPVTTPEMLVNGSLYRLYHETLEKTRTKESLGAVEAHVAHLQQSIRKTVVEVETRIELNTRLIYEERERLLQQKIRQTKEERSAIEIQRFVRGRLGRKKAQDIWAQYFVLVRGRAIRKGKCEECGEHPAVLECHECEESLHFCPVCWVQVHSTRRRKTHVPIPMAVAPLHEKPALSTRPQPVIMSERSDKLPKDPLQNRPKSPLALVLAAPRPMELPPSSDGFQKPYDVVREGIGGTTSGVQGPLTTEAKAIMQTKSPGVVKTPSASTTASASAHTDVVGTVKREVATIDEQTEALGAKKASSTKLTAKSKTKGTTQPRTSLRERMKAEKPPLEEANAINDTEKRAVIDQESNVLLDVSSQQAPSSQVHGATSTTAQQTTTEPRNDRQDQAARKIQALHRQRHVRKQDNQDTNKPDAAN